MPITFVVILALGFLAYSLWVGAHNRQANRERREFFLLRPQLSWDQAYAEKYAPHGFDEKLCIAVANAAARAIGCQPGQIWPQCRFDVQFRFRGVSWLGIAEDDALEMFEAAYLPQAVEELYGVYQAPENAASIGELLGHLSDQAAQDRNTLT